MNRPDPLLVVQFVLLTAAAALVGAYHYLYGLGGLLALLPNVHPVVGLLYTLAFVLGFAFIPLLAWTIGPTLPAFLGEMIANLIWVTTMIGVRAGLLVQRETDEYDIERGGDDLGPKSYVTRWSLVPFGITFEATRDAFMPTVLSEREGREVESIEFGDSTIATADVERGPAGTKWYVSRSDVGNLLVPVGEYLSQLRDAASWEIGDEAWSEALAEYGGDTSGYTNRTLLVGTVVFTGLGLGLGYVFFF